MILKRFVDRELAGILLDRLQVVLHACETQNREAGKRAISALAQLISERILVDESQPNLCADCPFRRNRLLGEIEEAIDVGDKERAKSALLKLSQLVIAIEPLCVECPKRR